MRRAFLFLVLFGVAVLCADLARSAPRAAGQQDCRYRWVGMHNAALVGISGVRMRVEVKRLGGNPTHSVWTSMIFDSGEWLQYGYMDAGGGPFAFGQCYSNGQLGCSNNPIGINPTPVLSTNTVVTFGFRHVGNNHWRTEVDGVDITDFTFGSATGHDPGVLTEESYSCRTASFKTLLVSPALDIFDGSSWTVAYGMTSQGADWGIEGQLQNPALGPNQVQVGSSIAPLPENSVLW
jgi:hypothetical protein